MCSQAQPGKLDIKNANLVFNLSVYKLALFQTGDYDVIIDFCVSSKSFYNVTQKVQRHDDLIKAHAVRKATFIRPT